MPESNDTCPPPDAPGEDCPLSVSQQNRNIACFAVFWGLFYLAAPVTYIGLTHANLLKTLRFNDTVCNRPSAVYSWMAVVPVLAAWFLPHPRFLKPLALSAVSAMAIITTAVAVTLANRASDEFTKWIVIAHAAVFGGAAGILLTSLWDMLRRGVSTSRRGRALGAAFGIGPLFACVGAVVQDALFDGQMLGGWSFGLTFPRNYMAMFAAVAPLLALLAVVVASFRLPAFEEPQSSAPSVEMESPIRQILGGLRQFVGNRNVLFAVMIYVIVYSGGNAILTNVSLYAQEILRPATSDENALHNPNSKDPDEAQQPESNSLGVQSFLRFGFKAAAGAGLGWLLSAASPRATLFTTTSVLLVGLGWALGSSGPWFLLTFGVMGAGELFGAYFPNYVTTASKKQFVRLNMAYLSLLTPLIGFSSLAFGRVSDRFGRPASFQVAAAMLVLALVLIATLLPEDPTPREPPRANAA